MPGGLIIRDLSPRLSVAESDYIIQNQYPAAASAQETCTRQVHTGTAGHAGTCMTAAGATTELPAPADLDRGLTFRTLA